MATPQTATEAIQLIGREDDANNVFNEQGMKQLITSSGAAKDHYTVLSIIGPQSTGKSTLMNGIFYTQFTVMDASKDWSRTTMGIWASICNNTRTVVLDVEGTDSDDNQNDLGFEVRSALFALLISDVIIFNICIGEIRRANSNPLLTKIFEEVVKKVGPHGLPKQNEPKFVVAVRNYDGETPEKKIEEMVISKINEIWEKIPQTENSKLKKYFKLHVELFPDYKHDEAKFNNKCGEIRGRIAHGDLVNKRLSRLTVFLSDANGLWKTIVENKHLDLPSHRETMARTTCRTIMTEKLEQFIKSSAYTKLTSAGHDNPRKFRNQHQRILGDILSEYKSETQLYGEYAKEEEENLKKKVLHHLHEEFKSVMTRFEKKILKDTTKEIDLEFQHCTSILEELIYVSRNKYLPETEDDQHGKFKSVAKMSEKKKLVDTTYTKGIDLVCEKCTSDLEEGIDSVVTKYHKEYLLQTEDAGLTLDERTKEKFHGQLNLIGAERIAKFKLKTACEVKRGAQEMDKAAHKAILEAEEKEKKVEKQLRITKGIFVGLGTVAAGVVAVATGPVAVLVGGTAAAVTAGVSGIVAATGYGTAAAISAVQGQPHHDATVAPEKAEYMRGNTEDDDVRYM